MQLCSQVSHHIGVAFRLGHKDFPDDYDLSAALCTRNIRPADRQHGLKVATAVLTVANVLSLS